MDTEAGAPPPSKGASDSGKILWVAIGFRVFHIGLCAFMCVAAVDTLAGNLSINDTDEIFIAAYVFLFAVILAVFEISQFKPLPAIEDVYTANFGFIYKPISKGVFIILCVVVAPAVDRCVPLSKNARD